MSCKKERRNTDYDRERDVITKPIVVKQTSNVVNRLKSASVNFLIYNLNFL
jgi:hypothetical protein